MAASVFDSPLYAHLFPTGDAGRLFSDSAAIRAMLIVEGALAKAQGNLGVIPEISAAAIHRATLEIAIDPGAIAKATGENGVCVPGLVAAFRTEMNAPEHAQYVHWGATSQDIIDTALMLRLRQLLALIETDLQRLLDLLANQAETHAETVMAGRTYAQHATVTSWGAVLADWGHALCDSLEALPALRGNALWVSLSGAAGTSAALGPHAPQLRAALADGLGLADPGRSWHVDRGPLLRITDWLGLVTTTLGRMGDTLIALCASDIAEIRLTGAGGSSTMPQKQNPVGPSALVALAHQTNALRAAMGPAGAHQHQRDGAAWFTEWMVLPQICLGAASGTQIACSVADALCPDAERMRATIEKSGGMLQAEALSFALSETMPRPAAQTATKDLCAQAQSSGQTLRALATAAYPELAPTVFEADRHMGAAPAEARAFVRRVRALRRP
ncbi:lyase family protein [Sulfitobacter sp. S190]|uniref:lyase family protein n=1 Tax=Sulfitobacter sp. S190 TaxID=2867022 RepID=UPI0021A913E9|nr:lyase family protein [Sulfitobacter sp. S190]UWR23242.1 adenylosuccinate lyase family protein [Sulfitobacter sp. S190]